MRIQSWKPARWRRIRDSRYQFSKSWRIRGYCSLGACQHFHFGTIQSNNTVEKSRFSLTVILLGRNPELETKRALSRNAQQVQRENTSTQPILSQVSGNASHTDSDQVFIHKHKFKSACMNLQLAAVLSHYSLLLSGLRLLQGIVLYDHFILPWLHICLNKDSCAQNTTICST